MKNIIKIAGIEFTEEELKNAFFNKAQHFIVKYRRIYNLKYDLNSGFQALLVYEQNKAEKIPLLRKGRFLLSNAEFCNNLIDHELFID